MGILWAVEKVVILREYDFTQTDYMCGTGALAGLRQAFRADQNVIIVAPILPRPQRAERDFVGAIHESPGAAGAENRTNEHQSQ